MSFAGTMGASRLRSLAAAAVALALGCGGGEDSEPGDGGELSCDLGGPLEVSLADGSDASVPIDAERPPSAQIGAQGALFVQVSVRVEPPLPMQPELQLELRARRASACTGADCEWSPSGRWLQRVDASLQANPAEPVDVLGVVLVVSTWNPSETREISAMVTDRCGRSGSATVVFAPQ